jgi:hypothetical protein
MSLTDDEKQAADAMYAEATQPPVVLLVPLAQWEFQQLEDAIDVLVRRSVTHRLTAREAKRLFRLLEEWSNRLDNNDTGRTA